MLARLDGLYAELRHFDEAMASLMLGLGRTFVDDALLSQVASAVRSELSQASIEISCVPVAEEIALPMFRFDLLSLLRNLTRNACIAALGAPPPARVRLSVTLELEPTGEETVVLGVADSSPAAFPLELMRKNVSSSRGLGIVSAIVERQGGGLSVENLEEQGLKKMVQVRLAHAADAASPKERSALAPAARRESASG
jgi:signal transduction histidine kinase